VTPTLLATALALAAPPAAGVQQRATELVAQLGDPDYRDREKASHELISLGYPALDAVRAGQKSADGEISERCRKLYPIIWRDALERRIDKLVSDPTGPVPADLPGAADWLKIAGDTKDSRRLYGETILAHPDLMLELATHPDRRTQLYADLARDVYGRVSPRPVGVATPARSGPTDTEALLFLFLGSAGANRTTLLPGTSSTYYYSFLNSPALTARLADSAVHRKLYAAWLERERYSVLLRRGIDIAAQHGVKECLPVLTRIAKDPGTVMYIRATAVLGFGKLGTKDDIKLLEPFLKDDTLVANVVVNTERGSVQLRDTALGAAVQMAGQSLETFGFERKPPAGLATISYTYFAFGTDEKRAAAHQKWKDWAAANLKK
jgi:hypothetical protein